MCHGAVSMGSHHTLKIIAFRVVFSSVSELGAAASDVHRCGCAALRAGATAASISARSGRLAHVQQSRAMSDSKDSPMTDAAMALAERVYADAAQPTFKRLGDVTGRLVHVTTAPLRALIWTAEQAESWLAPAVAARVARIAQRFRVPPNPAVATQAIGGLMLTAGDAELRELFANLVAASMDSRRAPFAHPSFAEKIRLMTPDEARILRYLSGRPVVPTVTRQFKRPTGRLTVQFSSVATNAGCECLDPAFISLAIDHLTHLDLLASDSWAETVAEADDEYESLVASSAEYLPAGAESIGSVGLTAIRLSATGQVFAEVCVLDADGVAQPATTSSSGSRAGEQRPGRAEP